MRVLLPCLFALAAAVSVAQSMPSMPMHPAPEPTTGERLGTVSFPISCLPSQQTDFRRGVALLHDFWYSEAQAQFERIARADPHCAIAEWGIAMSGWHQIWNRPDEDAMKRGWEAMERAQGEHARSQRERDYIDALSAFYRPGPQDFVARAHAYSGAMEKVYRQYPEDADAGAFYALSLLAVEAPDDTTLTQEHKALAVLRPLFVTHPDNPGVVHYIIHACDNPAMAQQGLAAADHYGEIAQSGAHAVHMSGHIYARLGLWRQDIDSQLTSIQASEAAEARGRNGIMDEPHSYDFLMYAYLQSAEDAKAKQVLASVPKLMSRLAAMPDAHPHMNGMVEYYTGKFPVFYALEMRDWQTASTLKPQPGSLPEIETMTWWARAIADGHLKRAEQAQADLVKYDALIAEVRKGKHAYYADSTGTAILRDEIAGWASYASGRNDEALKQMRAAADLQDMVGQGEVDIPAREMLADMLLELGQAQQALVEYRVATRLSPNRFNGLYNAGRAAEAAGQKDEATRYYAALLKSTADGGESRRPELAHAKSFVAAGQLALDAGR